MKILVTGCGGDIGNSIGKILKKSDHEAIGVDIHNDHPGRFIFDKCEVVKRADDSDYIDCMTDVIKKNKIDFIISACEPEQRVFLQKDINEISGVQILNLHEKSMEVGFDKLQTAEFIGKIGPAPWTIALPEKPKSLPCIMKDRFGSGSKKLEMIDESNLEHFLNSKGDYIFQEQLLPEDEYTCGLFRSKSGEIRSIIFRRRLLGGFTDYAKVVKNDDIEKLLNAVAKELDLVGSINVQLRLTKKGPVVFEINPRFSSTVMFRHMLGFEDVLWVINDHLGNEIGKYDPAPDGSEIFKGYKEYVQIKDEGEL